jgi:threonine synthase
VLLVEGTYDDAFDLCLEATAAFGWYCRNTAYNPYMAEGKKTVVYELYDQLAGEQRSRGAEENVNYPLTHIFVSVGDGCIISGVFKGLRDLVAIGRLPQLHKLIGIQAALSSFLFDAWRLDEDVLTYRPITTHTIADSISAGLPRDRVKAITAVRGTKGAFIKVSDHEILDAIPALAQGSGVFAEPAAAATYAGLQKAAQEGLVEADARVALLITGNGLKDVGAAMKATGQAITIQPELSFVEQALANMT